MHNCNADVNTLSRLVARVEVCLFRIAILHSTSNIILARCSRNPRTSTLRRCYYTWAWFFGIFITFTVQIFLCVSPRKLRRFQFKELCDFFRSFSYFRLVNFSSQREDRRESRKWRKSRQSKCQTVSRLPVFKYIIRKIWSFPRYFWHSFFSSSHVSPEEIHFFVLLFHGLKFSSNVSDLYVVFSWTTRNTLNGIAVKLQRFRCNDNSSITWQIFPSFGAEIEN